MIHVNNYSKADYFIQDYVLNLVLIFKQPWIKEFS